MQIAQVLQPIGGFHIDGNLISNSPTLGFGDWIIGLAGSGGFVFKFLTVSLKKQFSVFDLAIAIVKIYLKPNRARAIRKISGVKI